MAMAITNAARALVVLGATSCLVTAGCSAAEPRGSAPGRAARPAASRGGATAIGAPRTAVPRRLAPGSVHAGSRNRPRPCHDNHGQLVRVSLRLQHLWMCQGRSLVRDTPITSGKAGSYTRTPVGNFSIQDLDRNAVLTLSSGAQYHVKYWIPFQAPLYGFHDSSWQHFPYGSAKYRKRGSHGCVHMPLKAIAALYRWAQIGAKVRIRG